MPRLDAERVGLFRALGISLTMLTRDVDAALVEQFELPLTWFEVMAALQRSGGEARVNDLRLMLGELPSSLSRRLDRLEEHGWVRRASAPTDDDRRAVIVALTKRGRDLWRDANVIYRRGVQQHFAKDLSATDIAALQRILGKWG